MALPVPCPPLASPRPSKLPCSPQPVKGRRGPAAASKMASYGAREPAPRGAMAAWRPRGLDADADAEGGELVVELSRSRSAAERSPTVV
ncbi:hypothetical protein ZEAMMB73_Zm00001d011653 [Zea mays]|uniref:Uncharacterized protein n=1 Tax=Zea mays TaxID=4577 RepID=A0A1D6G2U2_MAIZE|nr:hypothetical protein ZEAMMB73_Zm00001d011653 [Zea mays]